MEDVNSTAVDDVLHDQTISDDVVMEDLTTTDSASIESVAGSAKSKEKNSSSNIGDNVIKVPHVGMTFKTNEEAKGYYQEYGVSKGFSILTKSSQKTWSHNDIVTCFVFVCSHFGEHEKKVNEDVPIENQRPNTSTMRGGCNAYMRILLYAKTFHWVVRKIVDEHNHAFPSHRKRILLKTNRKFPQVAKRMVEDFHVENLSVNKLKSILGGDMIGFNDRACWNHLRDVRQKLEVGDAQWVFQYFQKRGLENPQFYHVIQCDGEGRFVNFFWVDARSRMSYKQFGDVVSFDTMYKTNKYSMPFAPFTGVNHHFQTIQFGFTLLQDETQKSFIWLFETWKEAKGGVSPVSILTDSDPAMRAAIPKGLYDDRMASIPVYNRTNFFAGMNSTGRSERINSFIKDYINSKTTLIEFVQKYERALKNIEIKERDEDYESEHKRRLFTEKSLLLEDASKIYTRNMFKKFREQWLDVEMYKCEVSCDEVDTYIVMHKLGKTTYWKVKLDSQTLEGVCECHLFEFSGIPYVHIFKVFSKIDVEKIPEYFIKKRWLKRANKFRCNDKEVSVSQEQDNVIRLNHLCQEATQLACVAYQTDEGYKLVLEDLKKLGIRVSEILLSGVGVKDNANTSLATDATEQPVTDEPTVMEPATLQATQVLLDPNVSQTKGRSKDDKGKKKRQRQWKIQITN